MEENIAIIDPVGIKAGIDHYDIQLLTGLKANGFKCSLYSNFEYTSTDIIYQRRFYNTGVSKFSAVTSNFKGFIGSLSDAKKNKTNWLILHVFRAGLFDLFTFFLARLLGFKIAAIVHDIESLDTITLPVVRKTVIGRLSNIRIVHNEFCSSELMKQLNGMNLPLPTVIPHVNFTGIFNKHLQQKDIADQIHPLLKEALDKKIPVLLFFGQIKKAKGLEVLLNACSKIEFPFRLVIAGKTRNESWDKFRDLIRQLNLQDKIFPAIRHITDEERDFLFSVCHAVILPYTLIYQSGVLLMAMSFPATVIVSDLPPNRDLVRHNVNGLLFESGNSISLAEQVNLLLSEKVNGNSLKQQALTDIAERYNPDVIGKKFAEVIKANS